MFQNLDKLPIEVKKRITPYCEKLLELHRENIKSIIIYGSCASGEYVYKRSDINLLVICENIEFSDLKKSVSLITYGRKRGIPSPLFLTVRHIETSQDVFPIEFLELKENHITIYGEDVLKSLKINLEQLRLECEEQIKGKLIRIRQAYLETGRSPKKLALLLRTSLSSILPPLRNILRISGKTPPLLKSEVIATAQELIGIDGTVFRNILHLKSGEKFPRLEGLFESYLKELTKIAVWVDELKV